MTVLLHLAGAKVATDDIAKALLLKRCTASVVFLYPLDVAKPSSYDAFICCSLYYYSASSAHITEVAAVLSQRGLYQQHRFQRDRSAPGCTATDIGGLVMTTFRKPAWWQLYALVAVLGGLFIVERRAALVPGWHMGVQAAIICVMYGLVWRWLKASASTMMAAPTLYSRHDCYGGLTDDWAHPTQVNGTAWNGAWPGRPWPTGRMAVQSQATVTSSAPSVSARTWPDHRVSAPGPRQPSLVVCQAARGRVEAHASHRPNNGEAA